ncbi:MAG: cytochrome b/b6 domain-containing protein, partial [Ramlibacter sp.]
GGSEKPLPATFDGSWMRVLHAVAAKLLMALIVLHVAAALWHHTVRRDGLLRRMGFGGRR